MSDESSWYVEQLLDMMENCEITQKWLAEMEPLPERPHDPWKHVPPSSHIH